MDERRPRVDKVSGEFERRGDCEKCGKKVKRTRTFSAPTFELVQAAGAAWNGPLRHPKCEPS